MTEITDYSMVIMKDSEDKPWLSFRKIKEPLEQYHLANIVLLNLNDNNLSVCVYNNKDFEAVCDSRTLVLLMKGNVEKIVSVINLKVGDNIGIMAFGKLYEGVK